MTIERIDLNPESSLSFSSSDAAGDAIYTAHHAGFDKEGGRWPEDILPAPVYGWYPARTTATSEFLDKECPVIRGGGVSADEEWQSLKECHSYATANWATLFTKSCAVPKSKRWPSSINSAQ